MKKKFKKIFNPKTIKQIGRKKIRINDKELTKELARKMINPQYFINENLHVVFKINLESHSVSHAKSVLTITLFYPDFGIETIYTKKT